MATDSTYIFITVQGKLLPGGLNFPVFTTSLRIYLGLKTRLSGKLRRRGAEHHKGKFRGLPPQLYNADVALATTQSPATPECGDSLSGGFPTTNYEQTLEVSPGKSQTERQHFVQYERQTTFNNYSPTNF